MYLKDLMKATIFGPDWFGVSWCPQVFTKDIGEKSLFLFFYWIQLSRKLLQIKKKK